jgi:L-fucose mutarotase
MLKGISPLISPDLLKTLSEMGHGDEIVFGDSNFPAAANAQRLVRADGHTVTALLDAVLQLFPLDYVVDFSGVVMQYSDSTEPKVWSKYREILARYPDGKKPLLAIPRFEFYERARRAYCIVTTSEAEAYANLIISKGCVR